MRLIAFILLGSLIYSGPSLAQTKACRERSITVMEIDRNSGDNDAVIKIDGKMVKRGGELNALRSSCGARLVVIFYSHARMYDLIESQFFSAKSGFNENTGRYFAFAVNADKSRMIYLKTMAEVNFTTNLDALAALTDKPPVVNQYSK